MTAGLAGQWEEARAALTASLDLYTAEGMHHRTPKVLDSLVTACMFAGRLDEALRHAETLRGWAERSTDAIDRATYVAKHGEVLTQIGRYPEAAEALRQALLALEDVVVREGQELRWSLLSDLGSALAYAGWFGEAERVQGQAYRLADDLGSRTRMAQSASQLLLAINGVGHRERALEWAEIALGCLDPGEDDAVVAEVQGNRALALSFAGDHDAAAEAMARAVAAAGDTPLLWFQAQQVLMETIRRAGRFEESAAIADALLARLPEDQARPRALVLNHRALLRLQQGRPAAAVADLEAGLVLKQQVSDHRGLATGHLNLARAHLGVGDVAAARRHAEQGEHLWEPLRRAGGDESGALGLFEQHSAAIFQTKQELALAAGDPAGALAAAEQGRSGPLSERIRAARPARASVPGTAPDPDRIRRLAARTGATLLIYATHFDLIGAGLGGAAPEPETLHMWVVLPDGRLHHTVAPDVEDEPVGGPEPRDAAEAIRLLGQLAGDERMLATWSRVLLEPVAEFLPRGPGARLVVVPQRALWAIPFGALPMADGEPLISHCAVTLVPSLHALELLTEEDVWAAGPPGARPAEVVVVGGVDSAVAASIDGRFQPLPTVAGPTAEAVAAFYGTPAMTGTVTVPAVLDRLGTADLLHFSCHALVDTRLRLDQPPGAIALTPGPDAGDHGQLTTPVIAASPTRARLAVLGCCATGQGLITMDGVLGPVRAFLAAGVSTVVGTLWEVPDAPTGEVMLRFHAELRATGDPAEALRRAVLRAREDYVLPEIWAAFTLLGAPGPVRTAV
ncbi:CHAT domain-containing protein [Actinacidiphila acididurans]|uniref:CHAT domain-containing protein n=1 Tax=Actinacidiphila acididurans TaxID=2784346 RepID=A0ABS2TWV6_9ACTN|nr:CHAT domain-containing protein [Actinacidiphila acididurans]MBM9507819.1 CHAT domain-containing protein [Actinacidiphila acididurans]